MAAMEGDAMQAGLLMEAAQAQQELAAGALQRLREHAAGLDEVVRGEIRHALLEELHALTADVQRAQESLRALQRRAGIQLMLWSVLVMTLAAGVPFALVYSVLPTGAQVAALSVRRELLETRMAHLTQAGADLELRHCGTTQRLCVQIERGAGSYGDGRDFLIVKGH
jgi:hypothetical protein